MEHKNQLQHPFGTETLSWQTPEYPYHRKSDRWYFIAGICALSLIVYALLTAQYSMAIAFALLAAVYHLVHNHPERNVTISITSLGIVIGEEFYQFADIAQFWILYDPPTVKRLHLRPRKRLHTDISIELIDQDPMKIRQLLETHVSEVVGKKEDFSDRMARWLNL